MSKITYDKQPKSFEEQLKKLKNRNLKVDDEAEALHYLSNISYYRLSAYFLPYQLEKDRFNDGTTFKQIISTYSFDRELRLLVFDCIERIEVAIRTQFIYKMAVNYNNSHWQDDSKLFVPKYFDEYSKEIKPYEEFQKIIKISKKKKRPEVFVKHYLDTYDNPPNPPSWMCFELLTIGQTNRLYNGLKNKEDIKSIAQHFNLHPTVFKSWLFSLVYVRNICAHHSRLWNKDLAIEPMRLKKPIGNWVSDEYDNNSRMFYLLCVLKYFLIRVSPTNSLTEKLEELFQKYPTIPIKHLGIPIDGAGIILDWTQEPLWQN